MNFVEFKLLFWAVVFVLVLVAVGISTDPSRKNAKAQQQKMAEDFVDTLDKGAPRE